MAEVIIGTTLVINEKLAKLRFPGAQFPLMMVLQPNDLSKAHGYVHRKPAEYRGLKVCPGNIEGLN